ncbi:hypothetical protein D3C85_1381960 [compost metagenome]
MDQQHETFQRRPQALEKDRFDEVVKRAAAHGVAAGLHIAGGGDKNHRAFEAFQQRAVNQVHALTVREIIIEQDQPRLVALQQGASLLKRARDPDDAQVEILFDILAMQFGKMRLIFHNDHIKRLAVRHGLLLFQKE